MRVTSEDVTVTGFMLVLVHLETGTFSTSSMKVFLHFRDLHEESETLSRLQNRNLKPNPENSALQMAFSFDMNPTHSN